MVEADPKSITRARLSRRTALTQAAGAVAAIGTIAPDATHATSSRPHPAAVLLALKAELSAADAAWQRALDVLAQAEQRLFALRPVPPAAILVPAPDGGAPFVPARWAVLRKHLARVHVGAPDLKAQLTAAHQAWTDHQTALAPAEERAWFRAAKAAEDDAAARIEVLHRRLAETPAHSWPGLRRKLAVLWACSGRARWVRPGRLRSARGAPLVRAPGCRAHPAAQPIIGRSRAGPHNRRPRAISRVPASHYTQERGITLNSPA